MTDVLATYQRLQVERAAAEQASLEADARAVSARRLVNQLDMVGRFFSVLADERRALLEGRVEELVDRGLKLVFGPRYAFKVRSELTGKQIKTRFFVCMDGMELNVVDSVGGGVADVVSFLLRIVMLVLKRPVQRRLLVLDEPMKWVSAKHLTDLTNFISELSASLELQIIMVTHRPELMECATTTIRVEKVDTRSRVEIC